MSLKAEPTGFADRMEDEVAARGQGAAGAADEGPTPALLGRWTWQSF